jgi:protease-4
MKQFFKMFFASFLAMVVLGVILFALTIGLIAGLASGSKDEGKKIADNSVLVIDMDKTIHELGEENPFAVFGGENSYSPGLYAITKSIKNAKTDDNIEGIFIKVSNTPNGWATLQQLRLALLDFKASHKFIYAYGEVIPQKSYYLATVADSIFINPVGSTELNGLVSQIPFFKGTLEKLDVEPEIFYAGKFKSATEPFRAEKISEPNRVQIQALQADIWNEFTNAVAKHAKVTPRVVNSWALGGVIQFPSDALRLHVVDALAYLDQVESLIRKRTGKKEDEKISYVELDEYANEVRRNRQMNDSRIAILFAEGEISDGSSNNTYQIASEDFVEQIRKIRKNDKIKAVVLRVNSPGGSALASEVILRELQLLREKKPLIVSMGDVAASGGYYIACQADSVFALPNTITGSIGVFTMLFNAEGLLKNKLGVTFDEVKNAPYADFPTVVRPLSAQESQRMQSSVDTIYNIFKRRVAVGRRISETFVDSIAQGRVWSGTDALGIGLIDGLGGLDRAIYSAARKANISKYQIVTYPEPVDKFEAIVRRLKGSNISEAALKAAVEENMKTVDYSWMHDLKSLMIMNGRAQMALPFRVDIK